MVSSPCLSGLRVYSLTIPSDIQLVVSQQRCRETTNRISLSQFWGTNNHLHRETAKHYQCTALQCAKPTSRRILANLEGDVPRQLLTRGLQAESLQQLVEVGEDTLTAAGEELEEDFPQLSFPAELLKGAPKAINDFLELPSAVRNERVGLFVGSWIYLTARPGVLAGAVDAYVAEPFQTLYDFLRGRKFLKRKDFILGKRIGEGNFGTVFEVCPLKRNLSGADYLRARCSTICLTFCSPCAYDNQSIGTCHCVLVYFVPADGLLAHDLSLIGGYSAGSICGRGGIW